LGKSAAELFLLHIQTILKSRGQGCWVRYLHMSWWPTRGYWTWFSQLSCELDGQPVLKDPSEEGFRSGHPKLLWGKQYN
jgi:hypothetical protein